MPIILPKKLPSATLLRNNGIELRHQSAPNSPTLRVSLLNLMTDKNPSETQFVLLVAARRHNVDRDPMDPPTMGDGFMSGGACSDVRL